MQKLEPVVLALSSDERYFPGLYCALTSALNALDPARKVEVKVLDGGLSVSSRDTLVRLMDRISRDVRLDFVTADTSVFESATLGPGQSHMTYCRVLLPQLVNVPRLIYLDCDVLVFRDLSELFDLELSAGKIVAAVPDSETLSLSQDSVLITNAMNLPADAPYFNAGVMLMDLNELRNQRFFERALEFLNRPRRDYRFWDQSAMNFLLYGHIETLPEHWNRASWRFDAQQNNKLDCVLHYTTRAPWLGGARSPGQVLFERFAEQAGLPVHQRSSGFTKSIRRNLWQNLLAPVRAVVFSICSFLYRIGGDDERSVAYNKVGHYWLNHIRDMPARRELYRRRNQEIRRMEFGVRTSAVLS
jgi:lipopolysaccharide biosynthesis glycosyltransferase